jgi:hypothetical protein
MYDEPTPPAGMDDPEDLELLRQFVLTAGEVAAMLGVSQQAIANWSRDGSIRSIYQPPVNGAKRGFWRYAIADVVERAATAGRLVRFEKVPTRLLTDYDVTALSAHPELVAMQQGDLPNWISENEAAKILQINRPTLRGRRLQGRLNPEIRVQARPEGTHGGVQYSGSDILKVAAGELEPFVEVPDA